MHTHLSEQLSSQSELEHEMKTLREPQVDAVQDGESIVKPALLM